MTVLTKTHTDSKLELGEIGSTSSFPSALALVTHRTRSYSQRAFSCNLFADNQSFNLDGAAFRLQQANHRTLGSDTNPNPPKEKPPPPKPKEIPAQPPKPPRGGNEKPAPGVD